MKRVIVYVMVFPRLQVVNKIVFVENLEPTLSRLKNQYSLHVTITVIDRQMFYFQKSLRILNVKNR